MIVCNCVRESRLPPDHLQEKSPASNETGLFFGRCGLLYWCVSPKKALFVGCARNCAKSLPNVLSNMDRLSGLFEETAFVVVENDSTDQTRHLLEQWGIGKSNFRLVRMDDLQFCALRTVRLAIARNTYLEMIRDSPFREFDYLFVMDMDDVNERELNVASVVKAVAFLEAEPSYA